MSVRRKGPGFICIGPEKTGTSWLHVNLWAHPQIRYPHVKEIRYFWEKAFLPEANVVKIFTDPHWHYESVRRELTQLRKALALFDIKRAAWLVRFLFFRRTDEWYLSLFDFRTPTVTGDISPVYCQLPEREVRKISALLPDVKIIMLLRDPVDRAWSKAKMALCYLPNKKVSDVPNRAFCDFFDHEYSLLSSYVSLINRWARYFPEENIFINYYDELVKDPVIFLQKVLSFLGVDPNRYRRESLKRRVNVGIDVDMPYECAVYLAKLYERCIREMCEEGLPYSEAWLKKSEALMAR